EAPLPAQPLQKVEAQLLAVQVAVEVEQVGLDQLAAPGLESGPHADADGCRRGGVERRGAAGHAGVYAVAGTGERLVGNEVGGREAEFAPARIAAHDLPRQLERHAQQVVCIAHLAGQHQAANVAGGDDLPVDLEQPVYERLKSRVGGEQARIALGLV